MAKYLVTGGCGFIGSHLVDNLSAAGHQVIVLDNLSSGKREHICRNHELVIGDIRDRAMVSRCMDTVNGCFHLAADTSGLYGRVDWMNAHAVNMEASINIFEAASKQKIPVIYTSSVAVYGGNVDMRLNEQSITKPVTAYGADKLGTENHARIATLEHKVPTLGLQLFNVYGPRQNDNSPYSGAISEFFSRMRNNEEIAITGDGEQTRDFVFIGDVVNFLVIGMHRCALSPDILNVCTGRATSLNQLAKTLLHLTNSRSKISYETPSKSDIYTSIGDPSLAEKRLLIRAKYSLYDGLRSFMTYQGVGKLDDIVA